MKLDFGIAPVARPKPSAPPLERELHSTSSLLCTTLSDDEAITITDPIVCELLCFISNKVNIMPYETLVKLCIDFYSVEDIAIAKDMLYACIPNTSRKQKNRRGENKKLYGIQDIVNVFLELPTNSVPNFVCRDLSKLPPLSMNNFDVSGIMRILETLNTEVKLLQETQKTSAQSQITLAQQLRQHIGISAANQSEPTPVIPTPPTADALPTHISIFSDGDADVSEADNDSTTSHEDDLIRLTAIQGLRPKPPHKQRYSDTLRSSHRQKERTSFAGTYATAEGPRIDRPPPNPTQPRRQNQQVVVGTGRGIGLRAAKTRDPTNQQGSPRTSSGIFISRMDRATTPGHIVKHIHRETRLRVKCEPLTTKYDSYRTFYIRATVQDQKRLLQGQLWPAGAIVRPYLQ